MRKNPNVDHGLVIGRIAAASVLCSAGLALATFGLTIPAHSKTGTATNGRLSIPPLLARADLQGADRDEVSFAPLQRILSRIQQLSYTGSWGSKTSGLARTAPTGARSNAAPAGATLTPFVSEAVIPTVSPPLRDLPATPPFTISTGQRPEGELTNREPKPSTDPLEHDAVVQTITAPTVGMPPVGASFEGLNNSQACDGCIPPDPNGAVGPNHYVQMVNSHFAIYNKTGALILGPRTINSLWSANPNSTCATHNNGDPIVIYDQLADRWLLSQFTVQSGSENYAECIAISQTPDPTGSYWLYQFDESADTFHDYPHIGIWPDGYYMTTNLFPNSGLLFSSGAGAWAFERPKMILGQAARYVYFDETPLATDTYTPGGQLPTSIEGKALPPAGAPNYFVEVDNTNTPDPVPATTLHDEMHIWQFHVDWAVPANSTFGIGSSAPAPKAGISGQFAGNAGQPNFIIPVADYLPVPCEFASGPTCIPQKVQPGQPPEFLEALGDRLMYRVTYRNFGNHESLLVSHTSQANQDQANGSGRAGVRWYELRNLSSTPTIYQQSTFAPVDPTDLNGPLWRWLGSAAMDHNGDIAIGYSASGPNYNPSLHYAGRLVTDPLNELTQGEAVLFAGSGIEVAVPDYLQRNRWGDYSALTVDPTDDCTFWYTNEYLPSNQPTDAISAIDWHTRIASFKFPTCVSSTPPQLVSVVSRRNHGGTNFDIPLPFTGTRGIECRAGDVTLVFTFAGPVTNCGSAGQGTATAGPETNQCTVTVSGLASGQYYQIGLTGVVSDTGGSADIPGPQWGLLVGDVNASGVVTTGDTNLCKAQALQTVTSSNFRTDINASGAITTGDVNLIKQHALEQLPSSP